MLPVLGFRFAKAGRQTADRKEGAEGELGRGAELVIHEVGAVFASAEQVMLVARSQSMVVRGETPACQEFLAGALAGRDVFSNIANIDADGDVVRSEEHTPELQSLMRTSYAVFCLKKNIILLHNSHYSTLTYHTSTHNYQHQNHTLLP